jgi:hypothetical protein
MSTARHGGGTFYGRGRRRTLADPADYPESQIADLCKRYPSLMSELIADYLAAEER